MSTGTPRDAFIHYLSKIIEDANRILGANNTTANNEYIKAGKEKIRRDDCLIRLARLMQMHNIPEADIAPKENANPGKLEKQHRLYMAAYIVIEGQRVISEIEKAGKHFAPDTAQRLGQDAIVGFLLDDWLSWGGIVNTYLNINLFRLALNIDGMKGLALSERQSENSSHPKPKHKQARKIVQEWWDKWQEDRSLYDGVTKFDEAMLDKTGLPRLQTISDWRRKLEQGNRLIEATHV